MFNCIFIKLCNYVVFFNCELPLYAKSFSILCDYKISFCLEPKLPDDEPKEEEMKESQEKEKNPNESDNSDEDGEGTGDKEDIPDTQSDEENADDGRLLSVSKFICRHFIYKFAFSEDKQNILYTHDLFARHN